MGHYTLALLHKGRPTDLLHSQTLGHLLERGEPLTARVSRVSAPSKIGQRVFRKVDFILERVVHRGESIQLSSPRYDRGVEVKLVENANFNHTAEGSILELRPMPGYQYYYLHTECVANPNQAADDYGSMRTVTTRKTGLKKIKPSCLAIYNDSGWPEFDPAIVAVLHNQRIVGYIPVGQNNLWPTDHLTRPLLHGEKISGRLMDVAGDSSRSIRIKLFLHA
jgi:hypothetical protein